MLLKVADLEPAESGVFFGRIRIVFGNSSDPGGQNIIRSNPAYCQILFYFLFSGSEPDLSGITDPDLLLWCCCS